MPFATASDDMFFSLWKKWLFIIYVVELQWRDKAFKLLLKWKCHIHSLNVLAIPIVKSRNNVLVKCASRFSYKTYHAQWATQRARRIPFRSPRATRRRARLCWLYLRWGVCSDSSHTPPLAPVLGNDLGTDELTILFYALLYSCRVYRKLTSSWNRVTGIIIRK